MELWQAIYNTGLWPKDFLISIIVPIQKKPNAQKCEDHRTISLIAHASKILLKVLNNRVQARTSNYIGWDQFGFRKGVGTREGIATVRTLAERFIEHDQSMRRHLIVVILVETDGNPERPRCRLERQTTDHSTVHGTGGYSADRA